MPVPVVELEGTALTKALAAAKAQGAKGATATAAKASAATAKASAAKLAAAKTAASGIFSSGGATHLGLGLGLGLGVFGPIALVAVLCAGTGGGVYWYMKRKTQPSAVPA